ncbi:diguanylate cyclase, partial [bacterium]
MDSVKKILLISSDKNLLDVLNFCFDGWGYEVYLKSGPLADISPIRKISPDVVVIDVHSATKSSLEICHALKNDFLTAFIPVITLINKRQLRSQLLGLKHGVDDYLIKPPDPLDLRVRIEMALRRSQYSLYSSPLTGLPGSRIIEDVVKERIHDTLDFSFGYLDIDNFKYFNDRYGYVKGDRVIMQTAYILYTAVKKFGNPNDFIGHIGGDDFIFITTPDKCRDVCANFIRMFDSTVRFHYSEADRENGFILAKDRSQMMKKIPLMSISIAIVNKNESCEFKNIVEINERLAEIKSYLKGLSGSKYLTDRRNNKSEGAVVYGAADKNTKYQPMGQFLLSKNIISAEQLEEALSLHWRRGLRLGEVLKELSIIKDEDLEKIL